MDLNSLPKNFKFIADGYNAHPIAAQQFFVQSKGKINFVKIVSLSSSHLLLSYKTNDKITYNYICLYSSCQHFCQSPLKDLYK